MANLEELLMYIAGAVVAIWVIRFLLFQTIFENLMGSSGGSMAKKLGQARKSLKLMDIFN